MKNIFKVLFLLLFIPLHGLCEGFFYAPPNYNLSSGYTGTLPVGNGGTGATTLTGILKGNGTSAVTAVTAPSGAIVGDTDTQNLTNKTYNKYTLTAPATSATLTIANGKTFTASNTLTFTGTDGSSVAFGAGGTAAYTGNNLSVFASTTSAQLAGVLSDETGTGAAVFADQAVLTSNTKWTYGGGQSFIGQGSALISGGGSTDMAIRWDTGSLLFGANSTQVAKLTSSTFQANGFSVTNLLCSNTAPTVSGFGTSPSVPNNNGSCAFTVNVGTGGSASTGTVTLATAATGWVCNAYDVTTPASFVTSQTGGSTTTATFTNYSRTTGLAIAWTASDVLRVSCFAY